MSFICKHKFFVICISLVLLLFVRHIYNRTKCVTDTSIYLNDFDSTIYSEHSDDTLDDIYYATGVAPGIARELIDTHNTDVLKKLNEFSAGDIHTTRNYIFFPITVEEKAENTLIPMIDLKKGDILITFNTHTFDWRHGHAAIVTDESGKYILEHLSVGNNSSFGRASKWQTYPSFIVLRHPKRQIADRAAQYAQDNLSGIKYNLFAGIVNKDKSFESPVSSSHCSHLVWQAYMAAGCDIDFDGGHIVTPYDISESEQLRVVQVFGVDYNKYYDRLLR